MVSSNFAQCHLHEMYLAHQLYIPIPLLLHFIIFASTNHFLIATQFTHLI